MAMSANAVLMKFFKLPPAVRMMLALAGFGSLASILFTLLPALRTRKGQMWVLIIGGIGLLIFLIIWLIRRMIFGKKSAQLSDALESQGPTRGDIAEQEQIYREKFRSKLADLKTNGLDVYKLPWFVLMGEPGCGKTASLIHSGLDFPLGKDEVPGFGGTRNYNWWFANDAVILDTAGRIAFHEEGTTDKVEWEYFCKLLKQNRPRCPINGIVIALPADKLLRDSSEERAQKATVLRERLRQMHQLLGVRFPTFLLVTKMDLAGGFSEYFEEIRVDLQQRNQMFGWSRPGEFQEPYDPAGFPEAFESVADRLRAWSMRYLQRKATDDELGMIVTFPESFRQIGPALTDYVATIFQKSPLLEPPFFRGFYFTSAVQEGAPILDIFSRTSTHHLSERQTKAVDSKAFFIHDLYSRKVFPEHGLVFRSAKQVSLNRRMRKVVWFGSAAMIVMMVTFFIFGWNGTRSLIKNPREDCATAAKEIAEKDALFSELETNLRLAKLLQGHYAAYEGSGWYARMLYIGANISVPQRDVGRIHARFVLDCIVKPALGQVEQKLRDTELTLKTPETERQQHIEALATYTQWFGEVVGQHELKELDGQEAKQRRTELEKMLRIIALGEANFTDTGDQFEQALQTLTKQPRSFARDVLGASVGFASGDHRSVASGTIVAGIGRIADLWRPITQIDETNLNDDIKYWDDFAGAIAKLRQRYASILALRVAFESDDDRTSASQRYLALTEETEKLHTQAGPEVPDTLHEAFYEFEQFLTTRPPPQTVEYRIKRLNDLLSDFEAQWTADFAPIEAALEKGAPQRDVQPQQDVYVALENGRGGLVEAFQKSVADLRTRLGLAESAEPLDEYVKMNLIQVFEAQPGEANFTGPAKVTIASNPFGPNNRVKRALLEMRELATGRGNLGDMLADLRRWPDLLGETALASPPGDVLSEWFDAVGTAPSTAQREGVVTDRSGFANQPFWKPVETYGLIEGMWSARRASTVGKVIEQMVAIADDTTRTSELPGLARLMPGFDEGSRELPFDRHRFNTAGVVATPKPEAVQPETVTPDPPPGDTGTGRIRRRPTTPGEPDATPTPAESGPDRESQRIREQETSLLYKYHTREFLAGSLELFLEVKPKLLEQPGGDQVVAALRRSADAYALAYFSDWYDVYEDPKKLLDAETLAVLEECGAGRLDWGAFVERLTKGDGAAIGQHLTERTKALIHHAVIFDDAFRANSIGDGAFDIAYGRLSVLQGSGRSLRNRFSGMVQAAGGLAQNVDPAAEFSGAIGRAWAQYLGELKSLGALTGESASSNQPPRVDKLRDGMIVPPATSSDLLTIAPLLELAEYQQRLLVHHLDQRFSALFGAYSGRFPMGGGAPIGVDNLVSLLKQAAEFESTYGALYQKIAPSSPSLRTLEQCRKWTNFLYTDRSQLMHGKRPGPIEVRLAVVRPDVSAGFQNAGSVYTKFTIQLPLLDDLGNKAGPIEFETRSARGASQFDKSVQAALQNPSRRYRWQLGSGPFKETTAFVSDLHPDADTNLYQATAHAWKFSGSPWSLLTLIGANADNDLGSGFWRVPVRIDTKRNPIGFYLGIQIGSAARTFPGTIASPGGAGERPRMTAAQKYLTSP